MSSQGDTRMWKDGSRPRRRRDSPLTTPGDVTMKSVEAICQEVGADLEELEKDEHIRGALEQGGIMVQEFSKQVEAELREVEASSVREYVQQSSQVLDLHNEMQKCDGILAKMQEMLLGFDADLGAVSSEIRELQRESKRMRSKLRNRVSTEMKLRTFLEHTAISPTTPGTICEGEIDQSFVKAVAALDTQISFLKLAQQKEPKKFYKYASVQELGPLIDKLKIKACARSREYLVDKMGHLRKLQTNVEVFRNTHLTKFASLYNFVDKHSPRAALELREFYIESMARALHSLFRAYHAALLKFDLQVANKYDLVCLQEAAVRSAFTSRVSFTKRGDAFSLGDRIQVLEQIRASAPPILAHLAQAENMRYPFEELFRSAVRHLLDAVESENDFVSLFFFSNLTQNQDTLNHNQDEDRAAALVSRVFGKSASAALEQLENKLFQCHDLVGLGLVAKVVAAGRHEMIAHGSQVLLPFFDHCDALLRPRLTHLLAANLESARRADPAKLGISSSVSPHYVARRYAELSASMAALFPPPPSLVALSNSQQSSSAFQRQHIQDNDVHGSQVRSSMAQLRTEIIAVLERAARSFDHPTESTVFLINNFDNILTILRERRSLTSLVVKTSLTATPDRQPAAEDAALAHFDKDISFFERRLAQFRDNFVEMELDTCFPKLIAFVKKAEATTNENSADQNTRHIERHVRDFAASWKHAIDKVYRDVLASFANFVNGMEILKQVLTQLLLYYTRFQEIIKRVYRRPPPFANDIVPTKDILSEIKKYVRSF